jgi:hypothetical protein
MEFSITIDLHPVLAHLQATFNGQVLPQISEGVKAITQKLHADWVEAVGRATELWSGERDEYMASIDMKITGPYSGLVWTDYKHAEEIETGRPAYDLKQMLNTSSKVRVSKKGRRYLIIPFRHSTPGSASPSMPMMVYKQAKDLSPSRVTGGGMRPSGLIASDVKTRSQMMVPKNAYSWGGRLPAGLVPKLRTRHKTDPYAGMVRFNAKTPGGKRYSTYMTFRVMAEGSPGWIVGPKPGLNIVKGVVDKLAPIAEKVLTKAATTVADSASK